MNAKEYYQQWLELAEEAELRRSFKAAMAEDQSVLVPEFCQIIKELSGQTSRLAEAKERQALSLALIYLNIVKAEGYHDDYLKIILAPEYHSEVLTDWLENNAHRIIGPKLTSEMLPAIFEAVRSGERPLMIREQAMMSLTMHWQLGRELNDEILKGLGQMFEDGIAPADNWHLPMTILINAVALGGEKLRSKARPYYQDCSERYTDFPLGTNAEAFFSLQPVVLREMLRKGMELKFHQYEEELDNLFHPKEPDDPEELLKPRKPVHREAPKISRNDPCPCGSGKKYKKCCGR